MSKGDSPIRFHYLRFYVLFVGLSLLIWLCTLLGVGWVRGTSPWALGGANALIIVASNFLANIIIKMIGLAFEMRKFNREKLR
jgi:hypothetical protein